MIPVNVKDRSSRIYRDGRRGRVEMWSARSADDVWFFERLEEPGTPWQVTNRDVRGWGALFGSLSKARVGAERQLGFDLALRIARMWGWRR